MVTMWVPGDTLPASKSIQEDAMVNLRERRISLEIMMPVAALAALVVGAVVASAQPASRKVARQVAVPQPVEMEDEEIVTEIAAEPEAMVIETPAIAKASAPRAPQIEEELGTSKLELEVPEGATVWLGKKKLGVAPIEKTEILEGRYLLRVELGDSSFEEWVDVPPGGTFQYRLSLTAEEN
jgi:hypothetical protein